ncbi:MAG TPA: hypothetical protein VGL76_06015 [Gaiellaceae bacterium]
MRAIVWLALVASAGSLGVAAAFGSGSKPGLLHPPAALSSPDKTVWMTEWVACHHTKLGNLAKSVGVKVPSGRTPQIVALLIAKKAEALLYDPQDRLAPAIDGCRNGILWRYYHPGS